MSKSLERMKDAEVSAVPARRKILIVEDEVLIAMDLRRRLENLGYDVPAIAASADMALELAGCHTPDLILMDIRLQGGSDGIKTAAEVRRRLHIPVIFLTSHADAKTLERAKLSVPFGYIVKPFIFVNFRAVIEIALQNHETELSLRKSLDWHNKVEMHRLMRVLNDQPIAPMSIFGADPAHNAG
jgi:CheY-like chemotaxis protein